MKETMTPDLSQKNPYYIPRERFYELRHFCLQFKGWNADLNEIDSMGLLKYGEMLGRGSQEPADPVYAAAERREKLLWKTNLVKRAAAETDPFFKDYILDAVTQYTQYDIFRAETNIPCCRGDYYKMLRRFYWILDKLKD